jgi:hypothetical protein
MNYKVLVLVTLLLVIGVPAYWYFTIISPVGVAKPHIEKPALVVEEGLIRDEAQVEPEHVQYIANEIGAYKLHDDPVTNEEAIVEIVISDLDRKFFVKVVDNFPKVYEGESEEPDLRLTMGQAEMMRLLETDDFNSEVVSLVTDGKITIEILVDEATLAMKGYKAIYDAMMDSSGMPTGQFISEFDTKLQWQL